MGQGKELEWRERERGSVEGREEKVEEGKDKKRERRQERADVCGNIL